MSNRNPVDVLFFLTTLASFFLFFDSAQADPTAKIAVDYARTHNLANDREWLLLLHDYPSIAYGLIGRGFHSMVDDPSFFLSKMGEDDAAAELDATIYAMYTENNESNNHSRQSVASTIESDQWRDNHAQCRFPARFAWLKEKIGPEIFSPKEVNCPAFNQWLNNISPRKIILIFPAAFLNNPASMFGHTLIRIESDEIDYKETILGYGASFAAETGTDGGLSFAYKGLLGGYHGVYSIAPYYHAIRQYSDLEHRDIWEYTLDFTHQQIARLVAHLWELQRIYFDYYFFDENCALHLLGLLDYGDPDLHLSEKEPLWVIPAEAVRTIVAAKKSGGEPLVRDILFRPSRSTKIHALQKEMDDKDELAAKAIAMGEPAPGYEQLSPEAKAKVLDLAIVYIEYLNTSRKVPVEETKEREHKLLAERSRLPSIAPPKIERPETRPEEGHRPGRLSIGAGLRGDRAVGQFRLRPAHHQNIDPQPGYVPGSEVTFFDLAFEQIEDAGLVFDKFVPLRIVSLAPHERFIRPWSWEVATGIERRHGENDDPLVTFLSAGFGPAFRPLDGALIYLLAEPTIELQRSYDDDHRFGAGPKAGVFLDLADPLRLGLSASSDFGLTGDREGRYSFDAELRYAISPGDHPVNSIRSVLRKYHELDSDSAEWMILLDSYF